MDQSGSQFLTRNFATNSPGRVWECRCVVSVESLGTLPPDRMAITCLFTMFMTKHVLFPNGFEPPFIFECTGWPYPRMINLF